MIYLFVCLYVKVPPCELLIHTMMNQMKTNQIFHELRCTVYGNQDLLMYSNQDLLSQRETDLSPSLAVSGFWLFPVSPNLRPVLGTNGPAQGAYLGKDSSNGNFREMVEIYTTMQIQFHMRLKTT